MTTSLLAEVKLRGYSITLHQTYREFLNHISHLGHSYCECEIKLNPNSPALLASDKAMPLHTDDPQANYISWYCKQNAEHGGESVLLDFHELSSTLEPNIIASLETIPVRVPGRSSRAESYIPMISSSGVYYADWLMHPVLSDEQRNALAIFNNALKTASKICKKLKVGESLTIDNRRILHSRTAFEGERELIRHWIKSFN